MDLQEQYLKMKDQRNKVKHILEEYYTIVGQETIGLHLEGINYKGSGRSIFEFMDKIMKVFY